MLFIEEGASAGTAYLKFRDRAGSLKESMPMISILLDSDLLDRSDR